MSLSLINTSVVKPECRTFINATYIKEESLPLLSRSFDEYFCPSAALPHLAIGIASYVVLGPVVSAVITGLMSAMEGRGIKFTPEQDIVSLMKMPGIEGIVWSVYVSIGAPILEELIFRGGLQEAIGDNKFLAILKTSVIFGLCHASPWQGWFNIPVVAATTLMGVFFGVLKEITGDLWAPIGLHATNNTLYTLRLHKFI